MSKSKGMPAMRGLEHVALTVPNLDEACKFFEEVMGCEVLFSAGSFSKETGVRMDEQINVHPEARCVEYRYVRCGNGTNIELFQYTSPDQKKVGPKNSDIGGHHLAFYVDDINAAIKHLKAHGVRVLDEPIVVKDGPTAGLTWIYFLAPWGMNLELVSCEKGIAHDKSGKTVLWEPKTPGERLVVTH